MAGEGGRERCVIQSFQHEARSTVVELTMLQQRKNKSRKSTVVGTKTVVELVIMMSAARA